MKTTEKQNQFRVVFVSHEEQSSDGFLINLLNRHPEVCIFDGSDFLIDKLLQFPMATFGTRNSVFFDLVFDLASDERFRDSNFTIAECEKISDSKNCYEAFYKLMDFYRIKTKPTARTVVYKFKTPMDFNALFNNLIVKDLQAKYIHLLKDESVQPLTETLFSGSVLSSIYSCILQVKQQDFIRNYEYEYKRLFSFLNASISEKPVKKTKSLYRKSQKLADVQNLWYDQVVSKTKTQPEEVLVERIFKD